MHVNEAAGNSNKYGYILILLNEFKRRNKFYWVYRIPQANWVPKIHILIIIVIIIASIKLTCVVLILIAPKRYSKNLWIASAIARDSEREGEKKNGSAY